jgi:ribosome-associated toxin RatA of RatAB toxin-antitoxin module
MGRNEAAMIEVIARSIMWARRVLAVALLLGAGALAQADDSHDIAVDVDVDDGVVRVTASYFVAASPSEVWAVITDFENMPRFVANLRSCVVLARSGDLVTVSQGGDASYGPIKFPFDSVRELRLAPERRIESRMISGTMKRYQGVTELVPEGAGTRVTQYSEAEPNRWVPPLVGHGFIMHETREQLGQFRAEILRRKAVAAK